MTDPVDGKLAINLDTCTGCSLCVLACPADVIRMDAATAKPVIVYPRDAKSAICARTIARRTASA